MPSRKQITIGNRTFETQSAAKLFIKEMLNRLPMKEVISEPEHSFLVALLSRHSDAAQKIGIGVSHFTVESAAHGTRCFYVTRTDGSKEDFSTGKCFGGDA